jgi:hypothetical protein
MIRDEGVLYDREMEVKKWIYPAKHIRIIDGHEDSTHTNGSKNEAGVDLYKYVLYLT